MLPISSLKAALSLLAACHLSSAQLDDRSAALGMINQARMTRGLQPLIWDNTLTSYADFWAKQMASGMVPFGHAPDQYRPNQGENLFERTSRPCDPSYDNPLQNAAAAWLAEGAGWGGQPISNGQEPWLHWSQCMWRDTTHIGCARAFSLNDPYRVYDVCRFYPPGNIIGRTPF